MKNRFELIRWINERCPQNKIHSIEQLSDGKHFLMLLNNIYPTIKMDRIQDGSNLINRLNNIRILSDQVKLLGLDLKIEVSKIAYKNITSIIQLLQQFQQFVEDTESQQQQREVSFQEPIEEIPIDSQPQQIQNEEEVEELEQFNLQFENLKMDLKQLLLSKLPHSIIYQQLVELLIKYDNSDQQIIDLQNQLKSQIEEEQQYQMTYNNRTSKYTHYDSLKSSQFYNQEPYLSGSQFSFSQQGTQSKNHSDSLFFVSEIKRL